MINGIVYKKSTGEITLSAIMPEMGDLLLQAGSDDDLAVMEGSGHPSTHYVKDGQLMQKVRMPLSVTGHESLKVGETLRIDDIPENTTVISPGGIRTLVNDGYIEWSSSTAGQYELILIHPQCLLERIHATVTDL